MRLSLSSNRKHNWSSVILWLIPIAFLLVFYIYPLGSILSTSLARSENGFFIPFVDTLSSISTWRIIGFTFLQATTSTLLTLFIGLPGAYLFARYDFRGKSLIRSLTVIPFVLPTLVVAAAFNSLLGPRGWVNLIFMEIFNFSYPPIQLLNTFYAILLAHVFYNITIVLRMVGDFWSHIDPRLTQAAQVLGANRTQSLTKVTLPILMPVIVTSALLVFIFNFTSFGVILVLGGPRFATLEVEIYYQTAGLFNLPTAAVLAVIQLVCTLILTIVYTRLSSRLNRPLTLRPQEFTQQKLTTWRSRFFAWVMISIILIILIAPLLALISRSFIRINPSIEPASTFYSRLTLDYYRELSINRRDSLFYSPPTTAITVSLIYAGLTVFLALVLGLPAAWVLTHNKQSCLTKLIDPLIMLPLGTSAVTLGLGFIIALSKPPLDLRASLLLIPLAHTLVAFPFIVRSLTPSLRSINPQIRNAAQMLGASNFEVAKRIDLPIVGRALIIAAIFAFAISLGEFGATALIARPEYPTIPILIYRFLSQPGALNYGQAMALSTILMLTIAISVIFLDRFRIANVGEF